MPENTDQSELPETPSSESPSTPCSVGEAMRTIKRALFSLNKHIQSNGLPAAVKLEQSWIAMCERPFPLTEGNDAETELQLFRIAHEMKEREVDIFRDQMSQTVTITISSQNADVRRAAENSDQSQDLNPQ